MELLDLFQIHIHIGVDPGNDVLAENLKSSRIGLYSVGSIFVTSLLS